MTFRYLTLISAAAVLAACSGATDTVKTVASDTVTKVAAEVEMKGADLSELPSGTYKSEQGHAYVAFQYWHQGFSKPIIRWGTTDATVTFDADNPENSTLTVILPVDDIDTGVPGVSAKGQLKRSDFGVDKYAPSADDIEIMIEVEFQKVE